MIPALILYALLVLSAELTLGNPDFPLCLWRFTTVPAYLWSVPVHAAGFAWLYASNRLLRGRPAPVVVMVSTAFFLAAESLNRWVFHFFEYAAVPFGADFSFAAIVALYGILVSGVIYVLRRRER